MIQPLNSIQRKIQPNKATNSIQCQFHSKTDSDSTIKPTNGIQRQIHSKTDSTIKHLK